MAYPLCSRCGKGLEKIDMQRGAATFGSSLPVLYGGVVCFTCRKIECMGCKSVRGVPDAPCSWCGSSVSPAYEHMLGTASPAAAFPRKAADKSRQDIRVPRRVRKAASVIFALVVLGLMALVTVPELKWASQRQRYARTRVEMLKILTQVQTTISAAPEKSHELTTINDFSELKRFLALPSEIPGWQQDNWGRPFLFLRKGDRYALVSLGPDGHLNSADPMAVPAGPVEGGGDDIVLFEDGSIRLPKQIFR